MSDKPSSVIWLHRLLIFRIGMILVITTIAIYSLSTNSGNNYLRGFTDALLEGKDIQDPYTYPGYAIGYITAEFFFPLLLTVLLVISLKNKKQVLFWIFYVIDFIISLSNGGPPIMSLIIGTLGLLPATQKFFKV